MKEHKTYYDRYQLLMFLVGNGVPPLQAHNLILMGDTYDSSAVRHVYQMTMGILEGDARAPRGMYYDVESRTTKPFNE